MSSANITTGARSHTMISGVLLSAFVGAVGGSWLGLPLRQLLFVTVLGPAIVLLWRLQRSSGVTQPIPAALPATTVKEVTIPTKPYHALFKEGSALSAEEARRALDDFLIDQQRDA